MNGDLWLLLMIVLPIIGISLALLLQKSSRTVRIAVVVVVGILFIAYLLWNSFFR